MKNDPVKALCGGRESWNAFVEQHGIPDHIIRGTVEAPEGRVALNGVDLSGVNYVEGVQFNCVDMEGAKFPPVARNIHIALSNVNGLQAANADLSNISVNRSTMVGANLRESDIQNAEFFQCDMTRADLSGSSSVNNHNISGPSFQGSKLTGAEMAGAQLPKADFCHADLTAANAPGADLGGSYWMYANAEGLNIAGADLSLASFQDAALPSAILSGADIERANFYRADLNGSDLSRTNAVGANFNYAKLQRADMTGMETSGNPAFETIFTNAELDNAVNIPEAAGEQSQNQSVINDSAVGTPNPGLNF